MPSTRMRLARATRARRPATAVEPDAVRQALEGGALGGFLVAQQAARRMLPRGKGAILFTGASASVKGYKLSAPFAMGKFALRGLAQSIARELAPQGIHVFYCDEVYSKQMADFDAYLTSQKLPAGGHATIPDTSEML